MDICINQMSEKNNFHGIHETNVFKISKKLTANNLNYLKN